MASQVIVPSNPADVKRIKDAVKAASDCLIRIDSEREEIKAIGELMYEELELPKKFFSKLVRVYHKSSYDKEVQDQEDFQTLYEAVVK